MNELTFYENDVFHSGRANCLKVPRPVPSTKLSKFDNQNKHLHLLNVVLLKFVCILLVIQTFKAPRVFETKLLTK